MDSPCFKAFQSGIKAQTGSTNSQEERTQEISQVIRYSSAYFSSPYHINPFSNSSNTIVRSNWGFFLLFSIPTGRGTAYIYAQRVFFLLALKLMSLKIIQIPLDHMAACTLSITLVSVYKALCFPDILVFFLHTCSSLNFNY